MTLLQSRRDFAVTLSAAGAGALVGPASLLAEEAPPEVTTGDIYRGVIPFVAMQLIALVLCFLFPGIALWLPKAIGW